MMDIYTNKHIKTTPYLSVLIPFYKDDPLDLLQALTTQKVNADLVEIILYDDGTNDKKINERVKKYAKTAKMRIVFLEAKENKGRSFARNALKDNAQANWILYLDADMRPIGENFLANYIKTISTGEADIIFGGFEVSKQKHSQHTELHRALSQSSDCLNAEEREKSGAQYVCSSNLCVRASVLENEGFDNRFEGWGWEDSEWAARANKKYRLVHIDNPALHLGLESTDTLLERFKNSGKNYKRFVTSHPQLAKKLKLYKIAKKLANIPGQKFMRPFLKLVVKLPFIPTKIRLAALKLWRASWYAEVLT